MAVRRLTLFVWGAAAALSGALVVLILVVNAFGLGGPSTQWPIRFIAHLHMNFGLAPFIALLIFLVAVRDARGAHGIFLAWPPILLLGEASYSIYLLHPITLGYVPSFWGYMPVKLAAGILFTLAVSVLSYAMIEAPSRRFLRLWGAALVQPARTTV